MLALHDADHWPFLDVVLESDPEPSPSEYAFATFAGTVCLSKDLDHVRLPLNGACQADLAVHPLLTTAAWMRARLSGLEVFHAGAVLARSGAWLVLGDKEAGKSTLLARLHLEGHSIVADDLAIVDVNYVYSGPRCLDLRPDMGRALGMGRSVRSSQRWRIDLPPIGAEHRVAGFVELRWSDRACITAVEPGKRLARLLEEGGLRPRRNPLEMLELATLPYFLVTRPRDTDDTATRLLKEIIEPERVAAIAPGPECRQ